MERVERKRVPEHRQRIDFPNRSPHHRRTRLGRDLVFRRGLRVAVAEDVTGAGADGDAVEHHPLADEGDACAAPAAVTRRLTDEERLRADRIDLLEIAFQIPAAD